MDYQIYRSAHALENFTCPCKALPLTTLLLKVHGWQVVPWVYIISVHLSFKKWQIAVSLPAHSWYWNWEVRSTAQSSVLCSSNWSGPMKRRRSNNYLNERWFENSSQSLCFYPFFQSSLTNPLLFRACVLSIWLVPFPSSTKKRVWNLLNLNQGLLSYLLWKAWCWKLLPTSSWSCPLWDWSQFPST